MDTWQQILAKASKPQWSGDLNDDCSAQWAGLTLRAEAMDENHWWWCVHDDELGNQVRSSNDAGRDCCKTGEEARHAAETAAHAWLFPAH